MPKVPPRPPKTPLVGVATSFRPATASGPGLPAAARPGQGQAPASRPSLPGVTGRAAATPSIAPRGAHPASLTPGDGGASTALRSELQSTALLSELQRRDAFKVRSSGPRRQPDASAGSGIRRQEVTLKAVAIGTYGGQPVTMDLRSSDVRAYLGARPDNPSALSYLRHRIGMAIEAHRTGRHAESGTTAIHIDGAAATLRDLDTSRETGRPFTVAADFQKRFDELAKASSASPSGSTSLQRLALRKMSSLLRRSSKNRADPPPRDPGITMAPAGGAARSQPARNVIVKGVTLGTTHGQRVTMDLDVGDIQQWARGRDPSQVSAQAYFLQRRQERARAESAGRELSGTGTTVKNVEIDGEAVSLSKLNTISWSDGLEQAFQRALAQAT